MANMKPSTLREVLKAYCNVPHKHLYITPFNDFMSKLDNLPLEEQMINKKYINDIKIAGEKFKVNDVYRFDDKNNTKLFNMTIHTILKHLNPLNKDDTYFIPTEIQKGHSYTIPNNKKKVEKQHFALPRRNPDEKPLILLKNHPLICELLFNLVEQINNKVLDSYLNNLVQEYYEIIESIKLETNDFNGTLKEIDECFTKHSWNKNNFMGPPNMQSLNECLVNIISRMTL